MYVLPACPVAAIRAEARYAAQHSSLPTRLWRLFAVAWQRRMDRQHAMVLVKLDHDGVLADFRRASHG